MYVALDVGYSADELTANAAAVVFADWSADRPVQEQTVRCHDIQPYVPGQFYRRELAPLLAILAKINVPITAAIVDGYVHLGERPGLGLHLWEATGQRFPVIRVAKSQFRGAKAVDVVRGRSKNPLFVTAVGMETRSAAQFVAKMHGKFRVPTLLKRVDALARM